MFLFKRLYLIELDCTNTCLFWKQLSQLVKGHDFLILCKALALFLFLFYKILFLLIRTWSNLRARRAHTLMEAGAIKLSSGRAEKLVGYRLLLNAECRWDWVRAGAWSRLSLLGMLKKGFLRVILDWLTFMIFRYIWSLLQAKQINCLLLHCSTLNRSLDRLIFFFLLCNWSVQVFVCFISGNTVFEEPWWFFCWIVPH